MHSHAIAIAAGLLLGMLAMIFYGLRYDEACVKQYIRDEGQPVWVRDSG
jgi:hypothetical protein